MSPDGERSVRSACPYCGVGCGIVVETREGRATRVSGDRSHPANAGKLCSKGTSSLVPVSDPSRLDRAMVRVDVQDEFRQISMDEAIRTAAEGFARIAREHGPDAVAIYVSGQMTLEAQYLANKLAKGFLRTRRVESNSRLCMAGAASGYKLSLGADAPPGSYDDLDRADLFLVVGSNMAECHPILFLRMMERVKAGARLVVVDPRRTATAEKAHLHLALRPGSDLSLLNGLLHLLARDGKTDPDFIASHTEGWEGMADLLADHPPERVARDTGLRREDIETVAGWIGEAREWTTLWTMGINQTTHGTWASNAICNLHLATGAIGRPGSGPFSLTGQPNAMGGREMGYMGPGLPGQRSALVEEDRRFVEDLWGIPEGSIPAQDGGGTVALFEAMRRGEVKACWIACTNPVATVPDRDRVIEALRSCELVVVQDAFRDAETAAHAHILLPGALWIEGDGVFVNSERSLTLLEKAVEPPGEALPDWEIVERMARAMGFEDGFRHTSASDVFDELKRAWNPRTGYDLRGASHERLRGGPLQWPCPPGDPSDRHPVRYALPGGNPARMRFPTPSGRARFLARPHLGPAEMPDREHPFSLNTGRVAHQWHTGTKTGRVERLNRLEPGPFVEIHPDDARALGIGEGGRVEIRSRRGRAVLPARLTDRVLPGTCFAPFHWNDRHGADLAINAVTCPEVDPISLQPELKCCAVSLSPLGAAER